MNLGHSILLHSFILSSNDSRSPYGILLHIRWFKSLFTFFFYVDLIAIHLRLSVDSRSDKLLATTTQLS